MIAVNCTFNIFGFVIIFRTVTILDDSETSTHLSDHLPKSPLLAQRFPKRQTIVDSFDLDESKKLTISSHQLSVCHETLSNDDLSMDDIERSTSNLHIGCGYNELKIQLLKRCGQTNVLAFNETYSARYES